MSIFYKGLLLNKYFINIQMHREVIESQCSEIQTIDYERPGHDAQSWQIIFVCSEHTNTQVDGNRCWLFIYSFLHFSHLYKVDTQSFFIHLKLLISDSPHQTRPGTRQEMIMKRNPAMS